MSESTQRWFVGVLSLMGFVTLVFLTPIQAAIGWIPLIVGFVGLAILAYFVMMRFPCFQEQLDVHEDGLRIEFRGQSSLVRYDQIEKMRYTQQHVKQQLAGRTLTFSSQISLELCVEGMLRTVHVEVDYQASRSSGRYIQQALTRCIKAVRQRLRDQLRVNSQVQWTPDLYLSQAGLMIMDGSGEPMRVIPFSQIQRWDTEGGLLRFWTSDDVAPAARIPTSAPNGVPLFALMQELASQTSDPFESSGAYADPIVNFAPITDRTEIPQYI